MQKEKTAKGKKNCYKNRLNLKSWFISVLCVCVWTFYMFYSPECLLRINHSTNKTPDYRPPSFITFTYYRSCQSFKDDLWCLYFKSLCLLIAICIWLCLYFLWYDWWQRRAEKRKDWKGLQNCRKELKRAAERGLRRNEAIMISDRGWLRRAEKGWKGLKKGWEGLKYKICEGLKRAWEGINYYD